MRRVTYHINDIEYMRQLYAGIADLDELLDSLNPFVCVYVLEGPEGSMFPDHYSLMDAAGRQIHKESLNGYQKGIVLCAADRHYAGLGSDMFGIMDVKEERI